MTSKAVQISIDLELLERIDQDPEVKAKGRSAFIRRAVELYLGAAERRRTDGEIVRAYGGRRDEMLDEVAEVMEQQAWPKD